MGHEYCGIVEEVGKEVRNIKPGQFVVGSFATSDNTCLICKDGYQSSCLQREFMSAAQAPLLRVPLADGTLIARCDQCAVGKRNAQQGSLRRAHEFALQARGLIAVLADEASVVGSSKRANHKLARLDVPDLFTNFFHDAAVLVTHGSRLFHFGDAAIGPEVRSTDTCS